MHRTYPTTDTFDKSSHSTMLIVPGILVYLEDCIFDNSCTHRKRLGIARIRVAPGGMIMGLVNDAVAHVSGSFVEYGGALFAIFLIITMIQRPKNLPPGPRGLPIIGALHLLGKSQHANLADMAKKYGPLMSFYLGQRLFIVASSADTAMEFLKTQDAQFCSRPVQRAFEVIFPKDVTFSDITRASRQLRKTVHLRLTSVRSIEESEPIRADEIAQMVSSISSAGLVDVQMRLAIMTANILTRSIISKRYMGRSGMLSEAEQKEIKEFVEMTEEISDCLGTPNPRDVIPALKWIDHNGLDRRLKNLRKRMESLLSKIISERRKQQQNSPPTHDLLDALLDQMDRREITEEVLTSVIWESFAAGMETSVLATEWAMAEVLRVPSIQVQAQAELDAVVGDARKVEEGDIPNLKYIRAIVKESFRLHPIIPLLIPHESRAGTRAFGYDIPAETKLLVNVWTIGRDPAVFTDPLEFQPERFLAEGPHADTEWSKGFNLLPFGSGRRTCMGMALGALLVERSVASLLHAFSWSPPPDGLDMTEGSGLSVRKAVSLAAIATARPAKDVY